MGSALFLFALSSFANQQALASNEHAVLAVLKRFESAVLEKDKAQFLDLFYQGPVTWVGVYTQTPEATQNFATASPEAFIDEIINYPLPISENFSNIKIQTDSKIASLYFDYELVIEGNVINWGQEQMSLINTHNGWKITSVIWSMSIAETQK